MSEFRDATIVHGGQSALATNKVLRNTYAMLGLTLGFSAITAFLSMMVGMPYILSLVMLIGGIVILSFVLPRFANSAAGLVWVFAGTGMLGASIGPMLSAYVAAGMSGLIFQALAGTAFIFFSLSAYALITRKDFSFMGGMLFIGVLVLLAASILNIFLGLPAVSMAISAAAILIFSGFILFDTSRIIHGGETNYLMATVQLYINIFNIFIHLLSLLGVMSDD